MSYYRDRAMIEKLRVYYESKIKLIESLHIHLKKKGNLSAKQLELIAELHTQTLKEKQYILIKKVFTMTNKEQKAKNRKAIQKQTRKEQMKAKTYRKHT